MCGHGFMVHPSIEAGQSYVAAFVSIPETPRAVEPELVKAAESREMPQWPGSFTVNRPTIVVPVASGLGSPSG
jgi:hypothetical protein